MLSFQPDYPAGLNDEQASAVDDLLDDLRDWIDVESELSYKERRQAAKSIGEHVKRLASAGLLVGAARRHMLLTGGVSDEPFSWRSLDIQIHRATDAQLAAADGTPLTSPDADGAAQQTTTHDTSR